MRRVLASALPQFVLASPSLRPVWVGGRRDAVSGIQTRNGYVVDSLHGDDSMAALIARV